MFASLHFQTVRGQEYIIWNNARYRSTGTVLGNGTIRYKCNASTCSNAIYVQDGRLYGFSPHIQNQGIQHAKVHHSDAYQQVLKEKAIASINLDVSLGYHHRAAYNDYSIGNPSEAAYIPYHGIQHRLDRSNRKYPDVPGSMQAIPDILDKQSSNGWTLNYWGHRKKQFQTRLEKVEKGPFKDVLMSEDARKINKILNEKRKAFKVLREEIDMLRMKITCNNSGDRASQFFLGSSLGGKLLAFGERGSYQIAHNASLLLFDASFKFTPMNATLDCDQQWIVHAVLESGSSAISDECYTCFHVLFKSGQGNHGRLQYEAALDLIISAGIKYFKIDLREKRHQGMADFEEGERAAIIEKLTISGNVMGGCGYHFVMCIVKAIKSYDLWDLYRKNKEYRAACRVLMALRDVHPDRVRDGLDLVAQRFEKLTISVINMQNTRKLIKEYFIPTWMDTRYKILDWNGYGKMVRVNDFAEASNNRLLCWLGVHPMFWEWLSNMQRFSALEIVRYDQLNKSGHQRKRALNTDLKIVGLKKLRRQFGRKEIDLMQYMEGVSLCYDKRWSEFEKRFG